MWAIGAQVHQMSPPAWLDGPIRGLPVIRAYSTYRLSLLADRRRDRRGAVAVPQSHPGRHDDFAPASTHQAMLAAPAST